MAWSDYISRKKEEWIGKKVSFEGKLYTVVDIDMNGALLINKPHYYCESYTAETTAIGEEHIRTKANYEWRISTLQNIIAHYEELEKVANICESTS